MSGNRREMTARQRIYMAYFWHRHEWRQKAVRGSSIMLSSLSCARRRAKYVLYVLPPPRIISAAGQGMAIAGQSRPAKCRAASRHHLGIM